MGLHTQGAICLRTDGGYTARSRSRGSGYQYSNAEHTTLRAIISPMTFDKQEYVGWAADGVAIPKIKYTQNKAAYGHHSRGTFDRNPRKRRCPYSLFEVQRGERYQTR
jgi:hypothetical protein